MGSFYLNYTWIRDPQISVSTWVIDYGYARRNSDGATGLVVSYLGAGDKGPARTCFYPGTPESLFDSMDAASSKGKWVHANIINTSYEIV